MGMLGGRSLQKAIIFLHYAKYIWATSVLITIVNVSKLPKILFKSTSFFLLGNIPLTTKLWFKIHNPLKSRISLNKIMWSSDVQTCCIHVTLFLFTTICQLFMSPNQQSTKDSRLLYPSWAAGDGKVQRWDTPIPPPKERIESEPML